MLVMDLDYKTTKILTKIKEIEEFNIGHFIIGESIFIGLSNVIKKFKKIIKKLIMKILGIGVDIIENKRIKNQLKILKFKDRIYSSKELKQSTYQKIKLDIFLKDLLQKKLLLKL